MARSHKPAHKNRPNRRPAKEAPKRNEAEASEKVRAKAGRYVNRPKDVMMHESKWQRTYHQVYEDPNFDANKDAESRRKKRIVDNAMTKNKNFREWAASQKQRYNASRQPAVQVSSTSKSFPTPVHQYIVSHARAPSQASAAQAYMESSSAGEPLDPNNIPDYIPFVPGSARDFLRTILPAHPASPNVIAPSDAPTSSNNTSTFLTLPIRENPPESSDDAMDIRWATIERDD